jgi:Transposase DDE domain
MPNTSSTPFFPVWRPHLAPAGSRVAAAVKTVTASTLAKIENRFGSVLPASLLAKPAGGRDRTYTVARTFWCFLWQILNPGTSGREVVRQLQALFALLGGPKISEKDGAYCLARQRLPATLFPQALKASATAAQQAAPLQETDFLQNRPRKVIDGTTVSMPDSKKNRKAFPKSQATRDGIGFPMMRVVAFFCLTSGAILSALTGNFHISELRLLRDLIPQLTKNDIVIGDRGFGSFVVAYLLQLVGVDFIGRSARKVDGRRRARRLGPKDWVVHWRRPAKQSAVMSKSEWALVPSFLAVRIVRGSLWRPGFRVRLVTVVTTLVDPKLYPAHQILEAYAQRWRLELCFDDLKTTLGMEMLSCMSPAMIDKELHLHLIAHNFIRLVAAQAASAHQSSIERISFKGTLDGLRQFCLASNQARTKRLRRQLWEELLRSLIADSVPLRPDRREPRAVKRQKNKYPRLDRDRRKFRDHPKRNVRRSRARRRAASLK